MIKTRVTLQAATNAINGMTIRFNDLAVIGRDYDQAIKWARNEGKDYKLTDTIVDEHIS